MPTFNFSFSSPHRPAHSSPLSSSPIRQSSPPLSPRNTNTLPRYDTQSSPIKTPPTKFKFAARSAKPNPLRLTRETAQESRRNLFLKNVRKRADDRQWERRGGDQEALRLEWSILDRQRRQQKNADLDGMLFEEDIEDIPEREQDMSQNPEDMMVDVLAQEEEEELNAMLAMLETSSPPRERLQPSSPALSDDDDYDSIFMDLISQQESSSQGFVSSGQMDMS
ncbi:uncharacterized protein GGS25DRAFT_523897 [Hypoxylon fragiforme]|uniref:uncharacterized protein n=1 Tax=Hypoxylon fragiforme TaxID=63214 RepID=UPI0020C72932|nr:uncharacterized protein GGS25DRAFT_523897 [Hypoxylon fragiforme]KAI2606228.1 hypothetical protein GGS25DRAFT_523897 [Hypoxylon fragiforme]